MSKETKDELTSFQPIVGIIVIRVWYQQHLMKWKHELRLATWRPNVRVGFQTWKILGSLRRSRSNKGCSRFWLHLSIFLILLYGWLSCNPLPPSQKGATKWFGGSHAGLMSHLWIPVTTVSLQLTVWPQASAKYCVSNDIWHKLFMGHSEQTWTFHVGLDKYSIRHCLAHARHTTAGQSLS